MGDIKQELYNIVYQTIEKEKQVLADDTSDLMEDLDYDSIQIMELFSTIEEKYKIQFTDYSTLLDKIDSVRDFVEYVETLISKQ